MLRFRQRSNFVISKREFLKHSWLINTNDYRCAITSTFPIYPNEWLLRFKRGNQAILSRIKTIFPSILNIRIKGTKL